MNLLEKLLWFVPKYDKSKAPQPRMGHSSCLWKGSHIVIFGGWNGYQVLSDVIFIDLKNGLGRIAGNNFLEKINFHIPNVVKGEAPMRQFHTANIIDNTMYIFGGGDGKSWLTDLMILNLVDLEWKGPITISTKICQSIFSHQSQSEGQSNPAQTVQSPSGRLQHSSVAHEQKIYIFGGEPD